jgi:putative FmdB family regulatory protein
MALYEYRCKKCNHEFEVLTTKPVDKKEKCPKCNSLAEKLISPSTFQLKDTGVGWADKGYSKK